MPTASESIRKHKERILQLWFDEASRTASARGLDAPEFTNLMPTYVSALAEGPADFGAFSGARRKHLEGHLASRIRQGFSIAEIVDEILLVGRCVQRVWEDERGREGVAAVEVERLWAELHGATTALTEMFTKHMAEDEQAEKRYVRRLRRLASGAIQRGEPPFRERLSEVLELIMEAMGAAAATLLLYHPATRNLTSAASVGVRAMEAYVTTIDPSSFVGRIASRTETTEVEDVATTALTIPDAVRRSGIHSALGIRLPARHTLRGVLYVGLREKRPFTSREVRRLESLGEQLTVHLDNAALFDELATKVEALHHERVLRERFVSILAHDLRGPLSTAKMAAQLLLGPPMGPRETHEQRQRELATRIVRNIDRTDQMVRDLLDANRVHAGEHLPLRLAECDLAALVRDTVNELATVEGDRFVVAGEEHLVGYWSVDELRRALWNLAMNATKYGAAERPITISVRATSEHAELAVHNEGTPIPLGEQEDLFRAFARGQASGDRGNRGWGLGLTLVRGCAEAHGGRVVVKSSPESGTTFTIELPFDARPFQHADGSNDQASRS